MGDLESFRNSLSIKCCRVARGKINHSRPFNQRKKKMKFMKIGTKPDTFYTEEATRYLKCDVPYLTELATITS